VQSIHDTFDVRRLLEGAAAARAAERATQEEIDAMRRLAVVPIRPGASGGGRDNDYREAEAANVRFHMAVAAAARNTLAQELIERCLAQVDRFMSLGVQFGPFQEGATAAHVEIVEAIASRDQAAARARMEEHLDCGSQRMKDALLRGQLATVGVE
jgi:DNA-binding GntR family transcriptional regulator